VSIESLIEWTDATWNFILGCKAVSTGCAFCYAIRTCWRLAHNPNPKIAAAYAGLVRQLADGKLVWTGKINVIEERLTLPLRWKRPRKIFVNSQSDLFHEDVPFDVIDRAFAVMALCPQHTFQILTKRPERMREYFNWGAPNRAILPNVWLGTSVENQKAADERIPDLLATPAAVRFLSCEPLLGPVDVAKWLVPDECGCGGYDPAFKNCIDWVIAGGESGPKARPMHPDWARSLCDQCVAADVPFFFKQWGDIREIGCGLPGHELYDAGLRVGKKKGGRELDGREWNEFPR
jgi:protein gp37